MLFKSTGIVNNIFNEYFFSFLFSSELIVNRILIVSIVVIYLVFDLQTTRYNLRLENITYCSDT